MESSKNCFAYLKSIIVRNWSELEKVWKKLRIPKSTLRHVLYQLLFVYPGKTKPKKFYDNILKITNGPKFLLIVHLYVEIKELWKINVQNEIAYTTWNRKCIENILEFHSNKNVTKDQVKVLHIFSNF